MAPGRPAQVLIRADASPRIGGGHIVRCLALADALVARGARVGFACAALPDTLANRIVRAGHRLYRLTEVHGLLADSDDWDASVLAPDGQRADAAQALDAAGAVDWVVLDHYRLDAAWLDAFAQSGSRRLVIDDLANRSLSCELLVDQTLGRDPAAYHGLVQPACRLLTGAHFALLRPDFAAARPAALRRRRENRVERLLVSLGTTDIGGVTLAVTEALLAADLGCAIDVVLMPGATSLAGVRSLAASHPALSVHVDPPDLTALLAAADIAVGAPGTSAWERCCLGLPTVILPLAANQRDVARSLAGAEAAFVVDGVSAIVPAIRLLIDDPAARARMIAAAFAVTDGQGTARVATAMLDAPAGMVKLAIRAASEADAELAWSWRNDPGVRAVSKGTTPIPWNDHSRWFAARLADADTRLYVLEAADRAVALVRFDGVGEEALVSIMVDPAARGGGIGRNALGLACAKYQDEQPDHDLVAEIGAANAASAAIFRATGFEPTEERAKDFVRYRRPAAPRN